MLYTYFRVLPPSKVAPIIADQAAPAMAKTNLGRVVQSPKGPVPAIRLNRCRESRPVQVMTLRKSQKCERFHFSLFYRWYGVKCMVQHKCLPGS